MKKFFLLSAMAFLCLNQPFAQCCTPFQNPSFEGTIKTDSIPPPHWIGCIPGYEGTFPLSTVNTFPAYGGSTYAAILFTENGGPGGISQGAISQQLNCPLVSGDTLTVALVDLPFASNQNPDNAVCEIYGGNSTCDTSQLLWMGAIVNTTLGVTPMWTPNTFVVHPVSAYSYITIVTTTQTPSQAQHNFYIGIDSLTVECNTHATSIDEPTATQISIYPNPATNTIMVNAGNNDPYVLRLSDLTGRELITKGLIGIDIVDISQLTKGIYLARIVQGEKLNSQKLIIQ
jgi:hypothetical protein